MAEIFGLSGKKVTQLVVFELVTLNLVTTWHGMCIVYMIKQMWPLTCGFTSANQLYSVYVANQVTSY